MENNISSIQPLAEMLAELESAVRAGDYERATQFEQLILHRLAIEAVEREMLELQVGALIRGVEVSRTDASSLTLEDLFSERSSSTGSPGDRIYPVWFGTNRQPAEGTFTSARHNQMSRGRVDVRIPEAHRFGELGSDFWTRLRRLDLRDDHLRLEQVTPLEREDFFAELKQAVSTADGESYPSHALFFLHGYNTTFEEAAIRAAQIGCDLKVAGPTAFFSWPSQGSVTSYLADEAAIEASERVITDFLIDFVTNSGAEKVHLIAHSMGNRGLLRALQRIAGNASIQGKIKFGQIFLAAPDVDRDLFLDLAALYPAYAERTTLYASARDVPVNLSKRIHSAPRAGYFLPYTIASGIDTIVVPNFNIDLLGHGYFAQAEALLHDIYDLMRFNQSPAQRQRIENVQHNEDNFWRFKR